ncbi:sugar transferase [Hyphomicrobiales bacterium 4NK60-0047b]
MRFVDYSAAIFGLIFLSPIMIIIAILIKLDSKGPALFKQQRVGKNGTIFTCLKFRTMAVGTKHVPTHQSSESSITKIGNILRRSKLDELPQLINVLFGQMALVGPRPGLPNHEELIEARMKTGALDILPGITGLSQVEGLDMSTPTLLAERDGDYAKSKNMFYDINLIFKTLAAIINKK